MPKRRGRGEGSIRQRRRADGSAFYEARVTIHGKRVSFYDDTKTGAQAKARAARADADRGIATPVGNMTVEQFVRRWLEDHAKLTVRHRTYLSYRSHVDVHIVPSLGHIRLTELTPGHVNQMLSRAMTGGLSATSARSVRATLSIALKTAILDHGLSRNVARLSKVPKSDRPVFSPEVVTPEEARAIIEAFQGSRLEPLVLFSIATGVRQGELLALRWNDIDIAKRTVTIRFAAETRNGVKSLVKPKTDKSQRTLSLPALALRALELRREQEAEDRVLAGAEWQSTGIVFANPTGGVRDGTAVTKNFQARLKQAGHSPIRWHALRRVFAALLQDRGVSLEQIRDLMGHSQLSVTEHYAYTMPDSLHTAMDKIDEVFGD